MSALRQSMVSVAHRMRRSSKQEEFEGEHELEKKFNKLKRHRVYHLKDDDIRMASHSYRQVIFGIIFVFVQYNFMSTEPLSVISTIHAKLRGFIGGRSPACIDSVLDCVNIDDVHSWTMASVWTTQSLIMPIWRDDMGETGIILDYLSLGEEFFIASRRTEETTRCPDEVKRFVVNCARRKSGPPFLDTFYYDGNGVEDKLDQHISNLLPERSLYKDEYRQGFHFHSIPTNTSFEKALSSWENLLEDGFYTSGTDEVYLMFIVVSPDAPKPGTGGIITLIQVHFVTDAITGDISPSYSLWSFNNKTAEDIAVALTWDILFALILFYTFIIELAEVFGFEVVMGVPRSERTVKHRSIFEAARQYIVALNFWNLIDWMIIFLGLGSLYFRRYQEWLLLLAVDELNKDGSNLEAHVQLITARTMAHCFLMIAGCALLLSGFRFFKYFADHPRLGEISKTVGKSINAVTHFLVVFVTIQVVFTLTGHFLFAYASPDHFGTLSKSYISTFTMITGEITFSELQDAYGSTTVPFVDAAETPVYLFYIGYFTMITMILLNVFLAVLLDAYSPVHQEVNQLPPDKFNVFKDIREALWESVVSVTSVCKSDNKDIKSPDNSDTTIHLADSSTYKFDAEEIARLPASDIPLILAQIVSAQEDMAQMITHLVESSSIPPEPIVESSSIPPVPIDDNTHHPQETKTESETTTMEMIRNFTLGNPS